MAENEILFRIKVVDEGGKLAALDSEIAKLSRARDELSKKIKAGNQLTAEEAREYDKLTRELTAVRNQRREMQKTLERETKAAQLNEKSLAAMRLKLSELRKEFDQLDPASDKSKSLSLEINKLQQEINGADFSTGNFRSNVGNYSNAIMDAFQKTGIFSGGLGNLGGVINGLMGKLGGVGGAGGLIGSVGALGAGLIALPLAAVAGGFAMLKGYFESTTERAIPLKAAVAGLKGAFDDLKTAVNANIVSFANFVTKSMTGIVGLFGGLGAQARFQLREALTTQQLEAQRALKFMEVEYAKEQVVIEELRVKAQQKDRYNLQEREAFLSEALEKEKNFTNKRVEYLTIIANTEEELQKMSDSNEEDENRLLEMKKQRYNAESELNRKSRELVTKLSEFRMQTTNENKAASEKMQAARFEQFKTESEYYRLQQEENERIRKEIDEIINLSDLYEDKWTKLQQKFDEQAERMKRIDEMRKGLGEEEIIEPETDALLSTIQTYDQLQQKIKTHRLSYAELRKEINKTAMTEQQAAEMKMFLIEEEKISRLEATKMIVGMGTQLFEEGTMGYKIFSTAQATMATYEAANKALAAAPVPFNIALAAMIIAQGLANVAKINEVKFQKGGILEGASHAQGGIPIRVAGRQIVEAEGGEIIVNKNIWTRPDYVQKISEMNYRTGGKRFAAGGVLPSEELDFERIVDTIVNKIAAIPVVVSERDISSTQRKVLVTNNLGKI